jgi:hypothetical protein
MHTSARMIPALLTSALLTLLPVSDAHGNRIFGIAYQESEIGHLTPEEISILEQAGIQWLLVEEPMSSGQRELVHQADFSLLVMVPEYFPIPYRLTREKFQFRERSEALMTFYRDDPAVKGFGLFSYGNWQEGYLPDQLLGLASPHLDNRRSFTVDTRPFSGRSLYPFDGVIIMTRSASQLALQLAENPSLAGILYSPEDPDLDLRDFQEVMELMSGLRDVPIFFHRNWFFFNHSVDHPATGQDIARVTRFYHLDPDARIANPPAHQADYKVNLSMFLLFLFWVVYALYFRLNPLYRKSTTRFFVNYDFFAHDVLMRRIRFTGDAAAVYLFACLMAGILGFSIADLFLDPVARQVLLSYTPLFSSDWYHPFAFFLLFFFVMAAILFVQITWLRIANPEHANTSQIATFMLWPQHINFLVVSIGVILLRSIPGSLTGIVLVGIFLAVTIISFFTTAYNMRRIHPTSPLYMASTYVLYVLVTVSVASWLIFGFDMLKAWDLASSLTSLQN